MRREAIAVPWPLSEACLPWSRKDCCRWSFCPGKAGRSPAPCRSCQFEIPPRSPRLRASRSFFGHNRAAAARRPDPTGRNRCVKRVHICRQPGKNGAQHRQGQPLIDMARRLEAQDRQIQRGEVPLADEVGSPSLAPCPGSGPVGQNHDLARLVAIAAAPGSVAGPPLTLDCPFPLRRSRLVVPPSSLPEPPSFPPCRSPPPPLPCSRRRPLRRRSAATPRPPEPPPHGRRNRRCRRLGPRPRDRRSCARRRKQEGRHQAVRTPRSRRMREYRRTILAS